jgi:signal transduction histidine kinase
MTKNSQSGELNNSAMNSGFFKGAIFANINVTSMQVFLKSQLSPQTQANISIIDPSGSIVYSSIPQLTGTQLVTGNFSRSVPVQDSNPKEIQNIMVFLKDRFLKTKSGSLELSANTPKSFIAFQPVLFNGRAVLYVAVIMPPTLTSEIKNTIAEQQNFGLISLIAIVIIATFIILAILKINQKLKRTVDKRTTELKATVNSLELANKSLEEHDKMQSEFVNIAAHELRTPSQAIIGYAEMLDNSLNRNRDYEKALLRNADRLYKLIKDILDVARIESQTLKLNKTSVDLNQKIRNVILDFQGSSKSENEDRKISIIFKSSKPIFVSADKMRLYEVILNLLSNAAKFTANGNVILTAERDDDKKEAIVTVKDDGMGINKQIMPKLFSKFASKSEQGTGLGLFISKSIINAHGGRIWAYNNTDDKGATFKFTLPLSEELTELSYMK